MVNYLQRNKLKNSWIFRNFSTKCLSLLGLLLIAGCKSLPCPGFNPKETGNSKPLQGLINVSIDGSGSMEGFSTLNDSAFHKTLEELDTTLGIDSALGFSVSKTRVKRIGREGKPSKKISNIDVPLGILEAKRPEFFNGKGKWPKISSSIEYFVNKNPTSVDILISDLEPDDASIKQVISAIRPKLEYENNKKGLLIRGESGYQGNVLVIVGIKSQFSGGVYPAVQGAFKSFPYVGLRPFYVMLVGPTDKVELIVNRLLENKGLNKFLQISRFSANPNSGKTEFINLDKTNISPASCLLPVFNISQGLSGKLRIQNSNRWLLAQKERGCNVRQVDIKFRTDSLMGFGSKVFTNTSYFNSINSVVTGLKISENETSISTRFSSYPGVVNILDLSADAAKLDRERWSSWNTSGTKLEGNKTQRLLALIEAIRRETDQYSMEKYNTRYAPVRICAAVKG